VRKNVHLKWLSVLLLENRSYYISNRRWCKWCKYDNSRACWNWNKRSYLYKIL